MTLKCRSYAIKIDTFRIVSTFGLTAVLLLLTINANAGPLINIHLPDYLKMDVEFRYRMEYRSNFDFNSAIDDKDALNLYRTRVSLKFNPVKQLGVYIQGQDSRISNTDTTNKTLFENYMDIRQLYVDYEDNVAFEPLQINKVSARVGRQEFSYGAQRLIGGFNWSNVAQTFDGGKVGAHFVPYHVQFDIFGGDKSPIKSPREGDDLFDKGTMDRVLGYYATAKAFGGTLIDQYLIHRSTDKNISFGPSGTGDISNYTAGLRVKKSYISGIDYEVEAAHQFGEFRGKDVDANMAAATVGYTLDHVWKPRAAFEFVYGSGDSNGSDNKMTTFDNLYPTNHLFYGYIDFVSLQNINVYHVQFSAKPTKKLKLQADLRDMYLDTYKDSYYNVARNVARTASSPVSTHLGNEVDLTADYKFNDYVAAQIGYSHFIAGRYLKQTGGHDNANFVYVQTVFSF